MLDVDKNGFVDGNLTRHIFFCPSTASPRGLDKNSRGGGLDEG
jgi:hypothetical protein